jgi:hypothetical protein
MFYRANRPQALAVPKERAVIGRSEEVFARGIAAVPVTVEEFGDFQWCILQRAVSNPHGQTRALRARGPTVAATKRLSATSTASTELWT